ncbi:mRNA surveillance protein pelota [Candidatus Woesearchaeota archaeon]|nr:mRNA surveillance protein pelota [Candidatus Woesearchaeota archaeon]
MKIVLKNLKQGEIKLAVETSDDVWYLSQLIDAGDRVSGKTVRKIKATEEADPLKRAVFMAIVVEKVDFVGDELRVAGKVIDGPEDVARGSFHTFSIEPGVVFSLIKDEWLSYQLSRLDEACEQKRSNILVCVFDREEAIFALLKKSKPEIIAHIKGDVERKRVQTNVKSSFYEQVVKQLEEYDKRYSLDVIVIASPAFWKEELLKVVKNDALRKKLVQATCSSVDERAIDEVLKRDEIRHAVNKERSALEMQLVDEVLSEIAKKGAVVYGVAACESSAAQGAVSKLLITDSLIKRTREEGAFQRIDSILRCVDKSKGAVIIVSSEHMGGKRLDGLGGIAALLRYKLSYE